MVALGRLAGLRIDVAPPPPVDVLPRMDIAVLVGFAAQGPAHRPVAVESVRQFEAIFGSDAPLAWDSERGERSFANLAGTVRLFFANGGRRVWVIRVARTRALEALWRRVDEAAVPDADLAVANRIPVPGMLTVGADGGIGVALVQARSLGAWSDRLRLSLALSSMRFPLSSLPGSPPGATVRFTTSAHLQPGDLIELPPAAETAGTGSLRQFARITHVERAPDRQAFVAEALPTAGFAAIEHLSTSPAERAVGTVTIVGIIETGLPAELSTAPGNLVALSFLAPSARNLSTGLWVRWSDAAEHVWVLIESVEASTTTDSPPLLAIRVSGRGWREVPVAPPIVMSDWAARLTVDLAVGAAEQDDQVRLNGVGLTPQHPASWWRQKSDDAGDQTVDGSDLLLDEIAGQRFPLAALDEEACRRPPKAWIPLAVPALFGPALTPLATSLTPLERDGLSRFDPELFLDPALADLGIDTLIGHADTLRYLTNAPRQLFGIHAALSIGNASGQYHEASLIAIPDATHPGWRRRSAAFVPSVPAASTVPPSHWFTHRGRCAKVPAGETASGPDFGRFLDCQTRVLPAPELNGPLSAVGYGLVSLTWSASASDAVYVLSSASAADFGESVEVYRGKACKFALGFDQDGIFYFRVEAVAGDERSAPSNVIAVVVRGDAWETVSGEDFSRNGNEAQLASIQRAVLRMAAASGQLFAVLSLPAHFRSQEAVAYAARLRASRINSGSGNDRDALGFNERHALSYGAFYHPWVIMGGVAGRSGTGNSARPAIRRGQRLAPDADQRRLNPPDGAILGLMAARARLRGAWIAPANEPLVDIVALTPGLAAETWLPLADAQINVVRDDPRGFLVLAADTLAEDLQWLPVNVRRLMMLLRRLALRQGAAYAFEPNSGVLQRTIERNFETILDDLLRRGAFAGRTAEQSFRVRTEVSVADRDAGRLLVELRIAPAWPLQFVTLLLVQSGERLSVVEEP